ncbi:MAG: 3-phosphoshikimate 1-carboxyvinyltransferase, partial [Spirochaetota bacterium]
MSVENMELPTRLAMKLRGELAVPGSKSHTIRALLIAALADGESELLCPLVSEDTLSGRDMVEQLGASVSEEQTADGFLLWRVRGIPASQFEERSGIFINVGNSGTSLYLGTAIAALFSRPIHFDGDASIRRRSAKNLLCALQDWGVRVDSENFCCPYTIEGPIRGGATRIAAPTSQYLSALLLALPLSGTGGEIQVDLLNEHPYID